MRPRHLLTAAVAALALALGAGGLATPATAAGPAATTTTVSMSPTSPVVGDTITLTATVTTGGDPVPHGQVLFDLAATEASLWGADSYLDPDTLATDVVLGPYSVGPTGIVTTTVRLTTETFPFLSAAGFHVAASYQPYDGLNIYDDEYETSTSNPVKVAEVRFTQATTTTVVAIGDVKVADTRTLEATVSPAVAGSVQFSVNGAPVGAPAEVSAGHASTSYRFTRRGPQRITAAFTPADPQTYGGSQDATGRTVTVTPRTSLELGAVPSLGIAMWVTGDAALQTAGDGDVLRLYPEAMAVVMAGFESAVAPVVSVDGVVKEGLFASADQRTWAGFWSWKSGTYLVTVVHPVTHEEILVTVVVAPAAQVHLSSAPVGDGEVLITATVKAADGSGLSGSLQFMKRLWWGTENVGSPVRVVDGTGVLRARYADFHNVVTLSSTDHSWAVAAWFTPDREDLAPAYEEAELLSSRSEYPAWAGGQQPAVSAGMVGHDTVTMTGCAERVAPGVTATVDTGAKPAGTATATVTTTGSCGLSRVAAPRAKTTRVTCQPTASGYACPLGTLDPGTAFSVSVRYPLPPSRAGHRITTRAKVATTGVLGLEPVTLASATRTVTVPKRTVLAVGLAPAKKKATSVRRGEAATYRVAVRNVGVVTADHVRACVTVGKGAKVRPGKGVTVRGRQACWTVPTLKKGRSATKALVLVAPKKGARLTLTTVVTPKARQAGRARLTTVVPVR